MLVTGGWYIYEYGSVTDSHGSRYVQRYGKEGFIEYLAQLKTGRYGHGCTSFLSSHNERVKFNLIIIHSLILYIIQVFMVTGGKQDWTWSGQKKYAYLTSTEVYRPSVGEWREVPGGALPRGMAWVGVLTLKNRVLLFGEKIILV